MTFGKSWKMTSSSPNFDRRHGRHPRRRPVLRVDLILFEDNLHRTPLDHLNVTAGRVLGWKQTEARARSSLNAVDMPTKSLVGVGIDFDLDGLAGLHFADLAFFEIRGHPDIAGDD